MGNKYKWEAGCLDENMAALIKGLLGQGHRAQDIIHHFRINSGRVTEIKLRRKFADVRPAPVGCLPNIEPVPRVKRQQIARDRLTEHRSPREREVNTLNEIMIDAITFFEREYGRIMKKYNTLNEGEKTSIYENLRQISMRCQDLSDKIDLNAPLNPAEKSNGQDHKPGKRQQIQQRRYPVV